jgi:hypothetical protein
VVIGFPLVAKRKKRNLNPHKAIKNLLVDVELTNIRAKFRILKEEEGARGLVFFQFEYSRAVVELMLFFVGAEIIQKQALVEEEEEVEGALLQEEGNPQARLTRNRRPHMPIRFLPRIGSRPRDKVIRHLCHILISLPLPPQCM